MVTATVHVEGLRELQRALNKVNRATAKTVRDEIKSAAEPIRRRAESNAFSGISNIGATWGRMRLGSTVGGVYLAPATRNSGGSGRPNLGRLLLSEAMFPAVEEGSAALVHDVDEALGRLFDTAGF